MPKEAEPESPKPQQRTHMCTNRNHVRNAYGGRAEPWRHQDTSQNTNKTAKWTPHPAIHTAKEKNIAPQICMKATASRTKTGTPRYGSGCKKRRVQNNRFRATGEATEVHMEACRLGGSLDQAWAGRANPRNGSTDTQNRHMRTDAQSRHINSTRGGVWQKQRRPYRMETPRSLRRNPRQRSA